MASFTVYARDLRDLNLKKELFQKKHFSKLHLVFDSKVSVASFEVHVIVPEVVRFNEAIDKSNEAEAYNKIESDLKEAEAEKEFKAITARSLAKEGSNQNSK